MALPSSGMIWMSMIRDEFGGDNSLGSYYRGRGSTTNNQNIPESGLISFYSFYGAVKAQSGGIPFGEGDHHMIVPPFQWMTIDVRAGGGGGGGGNIDTWPGSAGTEGGNSHTYEGGANVFAGGGHGGSGSNYYGGVNYWPYGEPWADGGPGDSSEGSKGGEGGVYGNTRGQRGGNGGRTVRTYYPGQLVVGANLTIINGRGGPQGGGGQSYIEPGQPGVTYITWG